MALSSTSSDPSPAGDTRERVLREPRSVCVKEGFDPEALIAEQEAPTEQASVSDSLEELRILAQDLRRLHDVELPLGITPEISEVYDYPDEGLYALAVYWRRSASRPGVAALRRLGLAP
jgi:hypothetical protein